MKQLVDLTKDLIAFKTTHDNPEGIKQCMDFIEAYFDECGLAYGTLESNGYRSVFVTPEKGYAPVLLMAHIDVVAANPDQFTPMEKDGKIFGRGAIDDKYAAALCMVLAKEYLHKNSSNGDGQSKLPFGVVITSDEEIGGHDGAEKVLEQLKCELCIGLDGGNLESIVTKSKGLLTLKLVCAGKAAHGAQPWLGENPIEALMEDYQKLKTFFPDDDPQHWNRTLCFSKIHAGESFNQVPEKAEAVFDIRYTEHDDTDELFAQLNAAVSGELSIMRTELMLMPKDSPYVEKLFEVAKGAEPGFGLGASDARFISKYDSVGIVWGPEGGQSEHTADEYIDIASLVKLYGMLDEYFQQTGSLS